MNESNRGSEDAAIGNTRKADVMPWFVELSEVPDSEDWLLEIDSPHAYLTFTISELTVLQKAVRLLNESLSDSGKKRTFSAETDEIALGTFNGTDVILLRDNEDFPRCFLAVGPKASSTLRISLYEAEMRAFTKALQDVMSLV